MGLLEPTGKRIPTRFDNNKKYESQQRIHGSNGPFLAVVWFDRRNVYFLNTMYQAELNSGNVTVKHENPDGSRTDVACPP